MSIYADLLFMHGHIVNVDLARQLAEEDVTASTAGEAAGAGKARWDKQGREQAGAPASAMPQLPAACSNR